MSISENRRAEAGGVDSPGREFDRRSAMKKLVVGGAIVWASPAILSSAPASASPSAVCVTPAVAKKVDWDLFTTGSTFSSTTVGGVLVTLTSTFSGGAAALSANKTIVASPQGAVSEKALRFEQTPVTGGSQSITLTFSTPVTAVTMPIYDVDTARRNWSDRIVVTTTPYSSSIVSPSTVNGTGTAVDPFKNSQTDNNFPNTSAEGNVTIGWAGPVSSVTFQFNCGNQDGGANQLIGIGDILFCA